MSDWIGLAIGVLVAAVLLSLSVGLLVSLPVVVVRAAQVLVGREWVPLIYNVRSLARRGATTVFTFLVLGLVAFVLTAGGMLALGIRHTLTSTARPENVKVLKNATLPEFASWISFPQMDVLQAAPGVARDQEGQPLVSGEMVVLVAAPRSRPTDSDDDANLIVRGVDPVAFEVHGVPALQGRRFEVGQHEIIIGKALAGKFVGAELGSRMKFSDQEWLVVGIADHGGSAHDSEIWGDVAVLAPVFKTGYSTVTMTLSEPGALAELSDAVAASPVSRDLVVRRETEYWRSLSENYVGFVTLLGGAVGFIFAFGAVLGALNTMYAHVAARNRELGTLRAIGFKPRAILVSVLLESMMLSAAGGLLGILGASLLGRTKFTLTTAQTLSEMTYGFHLSPSLALACFAQALLLGYAGGLLPALRAARTPIVSAIRSD